MPGQLSLRYFGISFALEPASAGAARRSVAATPEAGCETGCDCTVLHHTASRFWLAGSNISQRQTGHKKTAAKHPVVRLRKLAEPVAPKRLPEAPLPNAAPMSAPLPCCISTRPIIASATRIWTVRSREKNQFILPPINPPPGKSPENHPQPSAAPPIKPPSISTCANNSFAFCGLTLPPYKIRNPLATHILAATWPGFSA
jgi:hypothetical protein